MNKAENRYVANLEQTLQKLARELALVRIQRNQAVKRNALLCRALRSLTGWDESAIDDDPAGFEAEVDEAEVDEAEVESATLILEQAEVKAEREQE